MSKEIKHITLGLVLSWIFGVLFFILGFGVINSGSLILGFLTMLCSFMITPIFNKIASEKLGFKISSGVKFLLVILIFVFIGFGVSSSQDSKIDNTDYSTQPNKEVVKNSEEIKSKEKLIQIPFENANNGWLQRNKIVFNDGYKSGESTTWDRNIFLYDIPSGEITQVTKDNSDQMEPSVYGNTIVWFDNRLGKESINYDIFMYNLDEGIEKKLNIDFTPYDNLNINGLGIQSLSLYEDNLFFSSYIGGWRNEVDVNNNNQQVTYNLKYLNFYNLKSGKHSRIDVLSRGVWNAKRHKNKVVWVSDKELYLYDLSTDKTIKVAEGSFEKKDPCVFEDKIVWSDNRNGKNNFDLYMLDVASGKETQITNFQDTSELGCSIYGNKIVYLKLKGYDVYASYSSTYIYDLDSKETKEISNPNKETYKLNPQIFENKVIWQEDSTIMFYTFN